MTSAQDWTIRLSALTIIVLIAATVYLGAQDEPTQEPQSTVASSTPHLAYRNLSEEEDMEIEWDQLLVEMKTELEVNGKAQAEPTIDRVFEGPRKSVISIESLGKTVAKHGLLRLPWDQRTTRRIELFELSNEKYLVVQAEEFVEVKAPYGDWYLEKEQSRRFVQTPVVGQVITGNLP